MVRHGGRLAVSLGQAPSQAETEAEAGARPRLGLKLRLRLRLAEEATCSSASSVLPR